MPIHFCETRQLAQEWTYRFFGAALEHRTIDSAALDKVKALPEVKQLAPAEPTTKEVRAWARAEGIDVPDLANATVNLIDISSAGGNSGGPLFGVDGYLLGVASRRPETGPGRVDPDKLDREKEGAESGAKPPEPEAGERSPFLIVEPLEICAHLDAAQLDSAQWTEVQAG